ncbi:MAG: hypothetical protein NT150_08070 [Bacteroidetes bacterium]|nr:hypothetical protein [Bacteroidota bacterium]
MIRHVSILIFGVTLGLFACNSSADKQERNIEQSIVIDSVQLIESKSIKAATEQEQSNNCVRG